VVNYSVRALVNFSIDDHNVPFGKGLVCKALKVACLPLRPLALEAR
jgi:hypothetical protein